MAQQVNIYFIFCGRLQVNAAVLYILIVKEIAFSTSLHRLLCNHKKLFKCLGK